MMQHRHLQQGFTAVELLVTLFVAAAFLVAGYQLFNVVIKDGGEARAESRAGNVAYDYLRRYSNSATNPCSTQSPLTNQPITATDLTDVKVTIVISCPADDAKTLSKVEAAVTYGNPSSTLRYATYVDKSKGATPNVDVTEGLIARYLLNGNANADVGGVNAVIKNGVTPAANKNGVANAAYSFTGANQQYLEIPSTFGLGSASSTLTLWVYQANTSASGLYVKVGEPNGYALGVGTDSFDTPGNEIIGLFEGVRWIDTNTALGTGWHFLAMTLNSAGIPFIYRDGVLVGSYSGTDSAIPNGGITRIGGRPTTRYSTSSIDDVRLYNRALTASEIAQLNAAGPK